ncbi:transposase, partial [Patescibacteria group bacterium]|nr:transposase [Patescibacteria group bacterium]
KVFNNDKKGFAKFMLWLKQLDAKPHTCMEATGIYGHALANFLYENDYPISLVNPARVKGFALGELSRNKTDKADAQVIARFCKAMQPKLWEPDPKNAN